MTGPNETVELSHGPVTSSDDIFQRHFIAIVSSTHPLHRRDGRMIWKKLMTKTFLLGLVLGALLSAVIVSGCTGDARLEDSPDPDRTAVSQGISEPEIGDSAGEHGSRLEGSESKEEGSGGSEHGSGGEGSSTGSEGGRESREAAMSSPITPLGQSWNGVLGGLAVSAQYDAATQSVHATVRNTLSETLCYVQAEPHLKSGTITVGELGPDKLGHLSPGQEATSSLTVDSEPELAGVSYDGYVVHMEVFDCSGPGPIAHTGGEGTKDSGGENGSGGERGNESEAEEEGSGAGALALHETFDTVRSGARLVLNYDAPSNSFKGTVENTTNGILGRVRVEVHLSNGAELGPTTPTNMAPREVIEINLTATPASFTRWTAHAEVGGGGEESESGGEHGRGSESGGEHGSGRESGGEHGDGERRGGS